MKYDIQCSCAFGVEAITKREIFKLGYEPQGAVNGRISVSGDEMTIARLNMFVRTADRVYIRVSKFQCLDFDLLFEQIFAIDWKQYIPLNSQIIVNAKSTKSKLFSLSAIQSISKKAIVSKLLLNKSGQLCESGTPIDIEVALYCDEVSISINTSGQPLHKRGYRQLSVSAPIKETLAAAIIYLSNWNSDKPFVDLCCGSGTFPIEAALMATNRAAGLLRQFDFVNWSDEFRNAFIRTQEEAKSIITDTKLDISGMDIDSNAISICNKHLQLAGLIKYVNFICQDMRQFKTDKINGTIICNLPYGQRLEDARKVDKLYTDLGNLYRSLDNWNLFALTNANSFERCFGSRAVKNRKLFNANLECYLYSYYSASIN